MGTGPGQMQVKYMQIKAVTGCSMSPSVRPGACTIPRAITGHRAIEYVDHDGSMPRCNKYKAHTGLQSWYKQYTNYLNNFYIDYMLS